MTVAQERLPMVKKSPLEDEEGNPGCVIYGVCPVRGSICCYLHKLVLDISPSKENPLLAAIRRRKKGRDEVEIIRNAVVSIVEYMEKKKPVVEG